MSNAEAALWEGAPAEQWAREWRIPQVLLFSEIGSTNDALRAAGAGGAPAGTTAIAEYQSAGRGRLGRRWVSAPGQSLLMSVLIRPATGGARDAAGALPIRVGLAVLSALRTAGVEARLKWPNDVLANGEKLAGVLCEAAGDFIVAGIGINVQQTPEDFPAGLAQPTTSIRLVTGRHAGSAPLAASIIAELRPLLSAPHCALDDDELARLAAVDAIAGRRITIDDRDAGTAVGIDRLGALQTSGPGGTRTFHAGTVRILP